jgi:PDZ domain
MVTSGLDVNTVDGATKPIPFTHDRGVFNITDLSVKEGDYSSDDLIGFIQNVDPYMNTIKGLSLKIDMFDRNNHLIDVAESGYSSLPSEFAPQTKYAFKIPIDKNNDLDHLHIEILATDWGTSHTYPDENVSTVGSNLSGNYSSDRPYLGIVGISTALSPDLSKLIGLNQTKGFLLTSVAKGSPAEKYGLKSGTITINGKVGADTILKIDNREVTKWEDLMAYLSQKHAGDEVNLTILRGDNSIKELDLILGQMPMPTQDKINSSSNDFSTGLPNDSNKSQEELYNECVKVAGKSLCDFLFKR